MGEAIFGSCVVYRRTSSLDNSSKDHESDEDLHSNKVRWLILLIMEK